jgi:hypothetical protein
MQRTRYAARWVPLASHEAWVGEILRQTFLSMLRNELYAGWICASGLRVAGKHEPIITEKLYADVQRALDGKGTDIPFAAPKR